MLPHQKKEKNQQTKNENQKKNQSSQTNLSGEVVKTNSNRRRNKTNIGYPKTVYLKNKRNWQKLFSGFDELRGVTYVTSPDFLLDLYAEYEFDKVELIIGSGYVDGYKKDLEGKEASIQALYAKVCDDSLTVYGTKATIHSKLYMLTDIENRVVRIITGSPNLSYNAEGSRQREYAWYFDLELDDPNSKIFIDKVNDDYHKHLAESDMVKFMEDLRNLRRDEKRDTEDFHVWCGSSIDDSKNIIRGVVKNIQDLAFIEDADAEESFTISIPKSMKKEQKKYLTENFSANIRDGKATLSRSWVLNEVTNIGMPLMRVDKEEGKISIGLKGRKIDLENDVSTQMLDEGLSDIESYINLTDQAHCHHPNAVKMTMMEAILYTMAAPFANDWLRQKRSQSLLVDRRGPRHLMIYGPGGNGKTTFGRFQNHLISTLPIDPISGKKYVSKNWEHLFEHVTNSGSPYPVIIDDIKSSCFSNANGNLEGRIKSYFENDWKSELEFPMMIFNSNHDNLEEWTKSRVRRLDFLVKFTGSPEEQQEIQRILGRTNHVFPEFAKLYIEKISGDFQITQDELYLAREVYQEIYEKAGRPLPGFFPKRPPEDIYDMDAIYCVDRRDYGLFEEEKKKTKNGIIVKLEFQSGKMMKKIQSRLPPNVASIDEGTVLIIENPDEYWRFMSRGTALRGKKTGILRRFFG